MRKITKIFIIVTVLFAICIPKINVMGEENLEQQRIDKMLNTISVISFGEEMPNKKNVDISNLSINEIKSIVKSDLKYFISGKNEGKKYFWTPEYIEIIEKEFPELLTNVMKQSETFANKKTRNNEILIASDMIEAPLTRADGTRSANHEIQYYSYNWYLHVTSKFTWSWVGNNITVGSRSYFQYSDSTPAFANTSVYQNGTTSPKVDYIYNFTGDAIFQGRQCYIVQYSPSTTGAYGVNVLYKN